LLRISEARQERDAVPRGSALDGFRGRDDMAVLRATAGQSRVGNG
jgi:hypothetical protein